MEPIQRSAGWNTISTGPVLNATPCRVRAVYSTGSDDAKDMSALQLPAAKESSNANAHVSSQREGRLFCVHLEVVENFIPLWDQRLSLSKLEAPTLLRDFVEGDFLPWPSTPRSSSRLLPRRSERKPATGEQSICAKL